MKQGTVIIALLFITLLLGSIPLTTAVNRHYDHIERPQSAVDMIMLSRQTPAENTGRTGAYLTFTGLLALIIAIAAGILAYLKYGAEFFKQIRLGRKKQHKRHSYHPALREVPNVPRLPTVTPYEDSDYYG
jgi:hypothetical protein